MFLRKKSLKSNRLKNITQKLENLERKINLQINLTREIQTRILQTQAPQSAHKYNCAKLNAVFVLYPKFERDFQSLLKNDFIKETADGFLWNKSKQSLAEYFGNQEHSGKKHHWQAIECLFNRSNLKSSFSSNGNAYKKPSKDYDELCRVLKMRHSPKGK